MVRIRWNAERGWHDAELTAYAPLSLDPGTAVLHYAQAVFEGLKAFRQADGGVAAFRPDAHASRFRRSARRLALPELPEETFLEAIDLLVEADHAWVPSAPDHSLYLRPLMYASEVTLAVHPADDVTFLLIASPSGPYFPRGVKPVTVWLSEDFSRAAPGGTGAAKTGGNYAGGLLAQAQAAEHGCDQVVWLDSNEHRWVEEMGGMNLCFVFGRGGDARVMTPALTGTLLGGSPREALLTLRRARCASVASRATSSSSAPTPTGLTTVHTFPKSFCAARSSGRRCSFTTKGTTRKNASNYGSASASRAVRCKNASSSWRMGPTSLSTCWCSAWAARRGACPRFPLPRTCSRFGPCTTARRSASRPVGAHACCSSERASSGLRSRPRLAGSARRCLSSKRSLCRCSGRSGVRSERSTPASTATTASRCAPAPRWSIGTPKVTASSASRFPTGSVRMPTWCSSRSASSPTWTCRGRWACPSKAGEFESTKDCAPRTASMSAVTSRFTSILCWAGRSASSTGRWPKGTGGESQPRSPAGTHLTPSF